MLENTLPLIVATGLIGLSLGQFFVSGLATHRMQVRQRAIRRSQLARLRHATKVARLSSQLSNGSQTASQWRAMEVVKVVDESEDTKSFYLADPNQQELPAFHPGQYLMVRPALAGKFQATRCYSLSVAPNSKLWRITVKRLDVTKPLRQDRRTGGLSSWLHENIREGDCLLVGGPNGLFYLPPENRSPLVLLAAGTGITPMASILQYATHFTPKRPVSLYFQVKDAEHWPLGPEVHSYCKKQDSCRVYSYLSRATTNSLQLLASQHPGTFRTGKFTASEVHQAVGTPHSHYFICGPKDWMIALREQLAAWGVPSEQIHWESFGEVGISLNNAQSTHQAHTIEFSRSGLKTTMEGTEQSLWELAQANEIAIPSGCLSGVCGSCRVKLLKGTVQYVRPISASLASDECLTCVARPTSDLKLDI
jgi:ferredoxin-NADP reductase